MHEEDQDADCKRSFILVSAGCDVIRIPKSVLKSCSDKETLEKIKHNTVIYDSDQTLYQRFKRYNDWRCFREQLTDHIAECQIKIPKSLKVRSASIPKLSKASEMERFPRADSPVEHWKRLADEGYIKKCE